MNTSTTPDLYNAAAVRSWLDTLYAGTNTWIHIGSTGNFAGRCFTNLDAATAYITALDAEGRQGIYARTTTLRDALPAGKRGGAADSATLPGLWADLDLAGPGHKTDEELPPDEATARSIITEAGLPEPTLWIHSGGGLYPWWLLTEHHTITEANLADTKRTSAAWQNVIGAAATRLGWHYGTGVGDLARVLRIPGTINRKVDGQPRPCRIIDFDGPEYTWQQLVDALERAEAAHPKPAPPPPQPVRHLEVVRPAGTITPNDDFEARADWSDPLLLGGQNWRELNRGDRGERRWLHPNATSELSATTSMPGEQRDRLYVFSTNTPFPVGESISKARAYALLHHGGDNRAATRALAALGYGTPLDHGAEERAAIAELTTRPAPAPQPDKPIVGDLHDEMVTIADAPADDQMDLARDLAARVAHLPASERQQWRDALRQVVPALKAGDFNALVADERKAIARREKEAKREERQRRIEAERANAQMKGLLLPEPTDPMAVARTLLERIPVTDHTPHTCWWRGDFYQWAGTRWEARRDSDITRWLYLQTEGALYEDANGMHRWAPNINKIGNLREAFGPALLARPWDDEDEKCVAVTNGVLEAGTRQLLAHTPRRFNLAALPFAYEAGADCPLWQQFLEEILPGDVEAQQFLGEWFGYIVSGRTDLQKIANLFGPPRCGKGTIARILEALLGPELVAAPSLSSLAGSFGEQPLIGKSLAVLSDANWNIRDVGEAVEILKKISGEDSRDVNRKNREAWHGKLGVRFLVIGNDMPKFNDASGALANRMVHIEFRHSFLGREDKELTAKLMTELPGILNWALDGLDRLNGRGRFVAPASSRESEREILRLTSPVVGFIEDRAIIADNAGPLLLDDLFAAYTEWCTEEAGRNQVSTKDVFSKDLRSAGRGRIRVERKKVNGVRGRWVYGLAPQEPGSFTTRAKWLVGAE